MKKKYFVSIFLMFVCMFILTAEDLSSKDEVKSNVEYERIEVNETYYVDIKLYDMYDQAIFTVVNYSKIEFDEGNMEKIFFETIENWIRDNKHRYYQYSVTKRKAFYSRLSNKSNMKSYQIEFKVNLKK